MNELTIEQMTREVAEWLHPDRCWHKWGENSGHQACNNSIMCQICWGYPEEVGDNPEYISPGGRVLLLKEMMQNSDCEVFLTKLVMNGYELANYMTDDTGTLLMVVWEYLRRV